jgi:hypothetical protein
MFDTKPYVGVRCHVKHDFGPTDAVIEARRIKHVAFDVFEVRVAQRADQELPISSR